MAEHEVVHPNAWELRQQFAADSAAMQRDSAALYAQDSRYAYQRRVDEMSQQEALAHQTAMTSRIASEAVQNKTMAITPPVLASSNG